MAATRTTLPATSVTSSGWYRFRSRTAAASATPTARQQRVYPRRPPRAAVADAGGGSRRRGRLCGLPHRRAGLVSRRHGGGRPRRAPPPVASPGNIVRLDRRPAGRVTGRLVPPNRPARGGGRPWAVVAARPRSAPLLGAPHPRSAGRRQRQQRRDGHTSMASRTCYTEVPPTQRSAAAVDPLSSSRRRWAVHGGSGGRGVRTRRRRAASSSTSRNR